MIGETEIKEMATMAAEAKLKAHCVYSNFNVGCSLRTRCGRLFSGCNVENASYSLTICAERTAICKAVSEGYKDYTDIYVTT